MGYTKQQIIKRFKEIHEPLRVSLKLPMYNYPSLNDYHMVRDRIEIECPIHGIFEQTIAQHNSGRGCNLCSKANRFDTSSSFIEKANVKHNNKYLYDLVDYKNSRTKVTITCKIHGNFEQLPSAHLKGMGCPKCGNDSISLKNLISVDDWLERVKVKFEGFEFPNIRDEWYGVNTLITIKCPKNHVSKITPFNFETTKYGCPECFKQIKK